MEIPMLDQEEFQLYKLAIWEGKKLVEEEIEKRNIVDYRWLGEIPKSYERMRYFIDMYRVITGFNETNPNAIYHHRIEDYGEDCPNCHKPLRTKKARYCVACGFGKEDFNSSDIKPLNERRSELFENE
jgi:hypothetical protein